MLSEQILQAVIQGAEQDGALVVPLIGDPNTIGLVLSTDTPAGLWVDARIAQEPSIKYSEASAAYARRMFGGQNQVGETQFLKFESVVVPSAALGLISEDRYGQLCVALLQNAGLTRYRNKPDVGITCQRELEITSSWSGEDIVTPLNIARFTTETLGILGDIQPQLRDAICYNFIANTT